MLVLTSEHQSDLFDSYYRLVARLEAFPGMQHVDVAGGTGDVAMRVHRAIQTACKSAAKHQDDPVLQVTHSQSILEALITCSVRCL